MKRLRVTHGKYAGMDIEVYVIPNSGGRWWNAEGINFPFFSTVCERWLEDCCEEVIADDNN